VTRELMEWFWEKYLPEGSTGDDPMSSPLRAGDLSGLPSATVLTAEFDPLRDEGELYAERLKEAGVNTQLTRYDGLFHGFFAMGVAMDRAQDAMNETLRALDKAFEA